MDDYYEILGIKTNATDREIKRAFHKLAREYHPDVNHKSSLSEDYFKKITRSYQVLSDTEQRRYYDIRRIVLNTKRSPKKQVKEAVDFAFHNFASFLNEFLFKEETTQVKNQPIQGEDIETELHIRFEESFLGCQKVLHYQAPRTCQGCFGNGWPPGQKPIICNECKGEKVVSSKGPIPFRRSCKKCHGKGFIQTSRCSKCLGRLRCMEHLQLNVEVPPGMLDNGFIKVSKQGASGLSGGESGTLQIRIRVLQHPHYRREQNNLILQLPICYSELLLGCNKSFSVFGKTIKIEVPAQTTTREKIRLKNKGFKNGPDRGDLIITLSLRYPAKIPDQARQAIKRLSEAIPGF